MSRQQDVKLKPAAAAASAVVASPPPGNAGPAPSGAAAAAGAGAGAGAAAGNKPLPGNAARSIAAAAAAKDDAEKESDGNAEDEFAGAGAGHSILNPPKPTRVTGFVCAEAYYWHDTGRFTGWYQNKYAPKDGLYHQPLQHFENAITKRRIESLMRATGLSEAVTPIRPRAATRDQLLWFHTPEYVDAVRKMSDVKGGDAGDCAPFGIGSYEIATLSAGGVMSACEHVLTGKVQNAYTLTRPPGHHAERNIGMGFCMFGNVALAAHYALRHPTTQHRVKRVAVIDWDVHHGNGTQQAFWSSKHVLFVSLHQDGLYPDRPTPKKAAEWKAEFDAVTPPRTFIRDSLRYGAVDEVGDGDGKGYSINVPLPPGTGEGGYTSAWERVVLPALKAYDPELIIVSCGFDAAALDPTSHMMLSSAWFANATASLMAFAANPKAAAKGRLLMVHEGGYSAATIPFYAHRVVETLTGVTMHVVDPYCEEIQSLPYQECQPHQTALIDRVLATHKPFGLIG